MRKLSLVCCDPSTCRRAHPLPPLLLLFFFRLDFALLRAGWSGAAPSKAEADRHRALMAAAAGISVGAAKAPSAADEKALRAHFKSLPGGEKAADAALRAALVAAPIDLCMFNGLNDDEGGAGAGPAGDEDGGGPLSLRPAGRSMNAGEVARVCAAVRAGGLRRCAGIAMRPDGPAVPAAELLSPGCTVGRCKLNNPGLKAPTGFKILILMKRNLTLLSTCESGL